MELKEFINDTLTQIAEGVQGAIDNSEGMGYSISPVMGNEGNTCTVHFDLAVECEKSGGADIRVVTGKLSEKTCNRINFDVYMTLPHPKEPTEKMRGSMLAQRNKAKDADKEKNS